MVFALAFVLIVAARPVSAAEVPYSERLILVQELAREFPLRGPLPSRNPLGSWAGIFYFTQWQLASGRDKLGIWEVVNREFTLKPYELASRLEPDCAAEASSRVCANWLRLFNESRRDPRSIRGEGRLWRSHVTALADSLRRNREQLDSEPMPEEEKRFWRGRTCFVFKLSKLGYPTTAKFIAPIVASMEPPCAPLGAPHCRVETLQPKLRRSYVRMMIETGKDWAALERCMKGF